MKVSVIIPAYNASKTILETLNSVFEQTYPEQNVEIIVVNDGSTDETRIILEKLENKITLINITNSGVSAARNVGYNVCSGDFIQYLDADDLILPHKIEHQIKALISNKADVAYGDWQKFTEQEGARKITETKNKQIIRDAAVEIFTDFWCPPAALLYTASIAQKIGAWNLTLPIIQDARYLLDAALKGGKFIYTPGVVALYRTQQVNSLSSNSLDFVKDILTNAEDIYQLWKPDFSQNPDKKNAVIKVLRYCIHELYSIDIPLFHHAIDVLLEIEPNYIPEKSLSLKLSSQIIGYRNAEKLASFRRRIWR